MQSDPCQSRFGIFERSITMKTRDTEVVLRNKNILRIALVVAFILLLPLVAMQFVDGAHWSPADFILAGAVLFGVGVAFELITRKVENGAYRAGVGLALGTGLFLAWVNLAVGIIGSEDNPINALYFGVLAVCFIGALIAQLRPAGMAGVMFATALAHALVTAVGLIVQQNPAVLQILLLNGFFVGLWVAAALLFRSASTTQRTA